MSHVADGPSLGTVLGGVGVVAVGGTVVAALLDPDPYLASLFKGGFALLMGTGLLAAAVRVRTRGDDYRSWRALGWVAAFLALGVAALAWLEVVELTLGEPRLVFAVLSVLTAGVAGGAVVAWYDHRRAAQRRRRREQQVSYREVFDNVEDAILVHDVETGEIVDANSSTERVYGYGPEELMSMSVDDFSAVEEGYDQAAAEAHIREAIEEGGTTFEWRNVRPDGERYWVEVSLRPATLGGEERVLAVVRDIDDRKERERELRVKDRALDATDVGVTISRLADRRVVYVNDAFCDITGYDRETVLGPEADLIVGQVTDGMAALERAVRDGESATEEVQCSRRDGSSFWNELTVAPVRNDDGEPTHYLSFHRDVTDRKRRERLFSLMNRVLRHNLRNDMTVVAGHARRLHELLDGERADAADRIAETAEDLWTLGEKARELESAVNSEEPPRPLDVVGVVESVADGLRSRYPSETVTVEAPGEQRVRATARIERALAELGENAIEHGGSRVAFEVERDGDAVVVRVTDDGSGLPEMERAVLRGDRETQLSHGTGMGLWLVNWVVTAAGGDLEVTTGDGTTVTVHLPAVEEPTPGERAPAED